MQKQLSGTSIREHRQRLGIKQAELARRVGISASYFNQIEHNRRRIGGKLFSDIAAALGVDQSVLAEGQDARLMELLQDARLSEPGLKSVYDASEIFSGRFPAWARLLAERHRRVQKLEHLTEALSDRLAHDSQLADALHELLSTVTAIRSSASILEDEPKLEPAWRQRFQRNIIEESARLSRSSQALVDYLNVNNSAPTGASLLPEEMELFLEENAHHFPALETGETDPDFGTSTITAIVAGAAHLKSPSAKKMAAQHLTTYLNDSLKVPLAPLKAALHRYGLDPIAISRDVGADLATTLRRVATLPDDLLPAPIGLFIADASGTITFKRQIAGFSMPRYSGACPLLPLFQAFSQPFRPMRSLLQQGGRDRPVMLTFTIAAPLEEGGFEDHPILQSHMLLIAVESGAEEDAVKASRSQVGRTCRDCTIEHCRARREPARMEELLEQTRVPGSANT